MGTVAIHTSGIGASATSVTGGLGQRSAAFPVPAPTVDEPGKADLNRTTGAVQRYLDQLSDLRGDSPADPVARR